MLGEDLYDGVKDAMWREGIDWPTWLDLKPEERRIEAFRREHPVLL